MMKNEWLQRKDEEQQIWERFLEYARAKLMKAMKEHEAKMKAMKDEAKR